MIRLRKEPIIPKFAKDQRTFETRVTFIRDVFTNKYDAADIMSSCIQHKLKVSLENYMEDLQYSSWKLRGEDPITILKRIDR